MKYRVRVDLSFDALDARAEADARSLLAYAKGLTNRAMSINEGSPNQEIAFVDLEICRHDEGLACERLERVEIRALEARALLPE